MNSRAMALFLAQKKEKERKLVCKRKRDARRRFQAYVHRRRVAAQLFVLLLTRNFFPLLPVRKIWTKPRTTNFWEETCQRWNDQDWKENFRMSRVAFEYLTMELSPIISKRDTNFRKAISARQRLAVTLYRLTVRLQTFLQLGSPPYAKSLCRYAMLLYNSFFRGTYVFHNRHKKFGKGLMSRLTVRVFHRL